MSIGQIAEAIQDTTMFTAMRESALVYPIVLSTHLATIAIFGGLILLTDLRLLGVALTGVAPSEIVARTRPFKYVGFVIMVTCGILLGGSELASYYANPFFIAKMSLLVCVGIHALVFRRSVYRNAQALDDPKGLPRAAKLAGALSIILWVSILSNGRWIAYWEGAEPKPMKVSGGNSAVLREMAQNTRYSSHGDSSFGKLNQRNYGAARAVGRGNEVA